MTPNPAGLISLALYRNLRALHPGLGATRVPQLLCAARAGPRHPLQGQLLTLRNVRSGGAGWPDTHGFSKGVKIRGDGLSPRNRSTRAKYWAWERVFSAAAPPAAPDPLGNGKNKGLCSLGTCQSESASTV